MSKWRKLFSLTFARSEKPHINVTFWVSFSTRIAKTRIFKSLKAKSGNDLIFRFWGAFGAQNAPERKSWPKSEKSAFGRFGLQKRAQNVTFITVLRSERKWCFCVLCSFPRSVALGAKSNIGLQKWSKTPQTQKIRHFVSFREHGFPNTSKSVV